MFGTKTQLLIWCLMAMSATAFAELPKAVITGPREAPPGELVILDASQSSGLGYLWLLVNSDKSFLPVDNGLKCVFSTGTPGSYVFILAVSGTNANGGPAVTLATHALKITGPTPTPEPTPNPTPPVPTPGKASAAILLYESGDSTQELTKLILQLRTEGIKNLKLLDKDAKQSDSDEPVKQAADLVNTVGSKPLPRVVCVDSSGSVVADADVKTFDDVVRLLASWGLK
jgi:hypothetical protein